MVDDASWRLTIQRGDLVDAFPVFLEAWSKSVVSRWHAQSVNSLIDFALNDVMFHDGNIFDAGYFGSLATNAKKSSLHEG